MIIKRLPTNSLLKKFSIQRAAKMTIQILYDKGLFDGFPNVDEVLKDFFCLLQDVEVI